MRGLTALREVVLAACLAGAKAEAVARAAANTAADFMVQLFGVDSNDGSFVLRCWWLKEDTPQFHQVPEVESPPNSSNPSGPPAELKKHKQVASQPLTTQTRLKVWLLRCYAIGQ